jgi:plasmid stabilization system protein ParE
MSFLKELDDCFRRIGASPVAFQVVRKTVRRVLLSRFPYCVYFVLTEREIVVIACLHGHQNPARWKRRL